MDQFKIERAWYMKTKPAPSACIVTSYLDGLPVQTIEHSAETIAALQTAKIAKIESQENESHERQLEYENYQLGSGLSYWQA